MGKICEPASFKGGQCDGVLYSVYITWESTNPYLFGTRYAAFSGQNSPGTLIRPEIVWHWRGNYIKGPIRGLEVRSVRELYPPGYPQYLWDGLFIVRVFSGQRTFTDVIYSNGSYGGTISNVRIYGVATQTGVDDCGDPPLVCRCSADSCQVDCPAAPDGFCCIDKSFTDGLLRMLNS